MGVCLFVSNKRQNGPELIGPKFCVGPHLPQGMFMDNQNFKNYSPTKSRFSLNFENPRFCLENL